MKSILNFLFFFLLINIYLSINAQDEEAALLLDLKKARADYGIANQKYINDKKLLDNQAISVDEFNKSKNEVLSKEVDYQKLILRLISQQSYVIIEKAIKYQDKLGNRRVRITLKSTLEGNEEYLNQFKEHFDVFTPEMRSGKVYNIFVSLVNIADQTIISSPYEYRIASIEIGKEASADFNLLRDVENLQVNLNYSAKKDQKNIFLEKDASVNTVDISSTQFSQEADLGSQSIYDLNLERFSTSDDVYRLIIMNLPQQISYDFIDGESKISQIKFVQGVNTKKISLKIYLPDRDDEQIVIDKPLSFYVLVLTTDQFNSLGDKNFINLDEKKLKELPGSKEKLELIPRGKGKIEVNAPNLYQEIKIGDSVMMAVTIRNTGSRRLDNIKISTDNPLNWRSVIIPDLIKTLNPEKEAVVNIRIIPSNDVSVGAQEVKIKTYALANNQNVQSEDKTVRIQINAKTQVIWVIILVTVLIVIIVGIVIFGIKISRK